MSPTLRLVRGLVHPRGGTHQHGHCLVVAVFDVAAQGGQIGLLVPLLQYSDTLPFGRGIECRFREYRPAEHECARSIVRLRLKDLMPIWVERLRSITIKEGSMPSKDPMRYLVIRREIALDLREIR